MTIGELIEHLKKLDKNRRVVVRGYEGGFHDINVENIREIRLKLSYWGDNLSYYGPHEEVYDEDEYDEIGNVIDRP